MGRFSPKIDELSENIIYLLSLNSKQSIKKIANKLKTTPKKIESRINKMKKEGKIFPLLVHRYPYQSNATVLIKLSHFDKEILRKIKEIGKLVRIVETIGEYDLRLLIKERTKKDVEQKLIEINKILNKAILKLDVCFHEYEENLGYASFCNNSYLLKQKRTKMSKDIPIHNLSKKELDLLFELRKKPHEKYFQLMKKLNLSYKELKKIIDNLKRNNIIDFSLNLNTSKLGLKYDFLLLKLNLFDRDKFEDNISKNKRIQSIKRCVGRWDYILSIIAKDVDEFIVTCRNIRSENKECIINSIPLLTRNEWVK